MSTAFPQNAAIAAPSQPTMTSPDATATPSRRMSAFERGRAVGVTPRSVFLGLAFTTLTVFWIHWAELLMGVQQGHTAIAATSTPVGAICILFILAGVNLLCRHLLPGVALAPAELLVVYTMITTSTVLSSSGQLHFIVPTVVAAFHYATAANGWASLFHRFVPSWMAQTNTEALDGFYLGKSTPPWEVWWPQMATWIGVLFLLSTATLCIVALLRRQWVDRERLAFPVTAVALSLAEDKIPVFRRPVFWLGAAIPFAIAVMNTIALNMPSVPLISLRAEVNLGALATEPPLNAMGRTPLSFYPFVIGIAYMIPLDVTFSAWVFTLITRAERVMGSALALNAGSTGTQKATFPFLEYQGAGAFLALTLVTLWLARGYLKEVWRTIVGEATGTLDDSEEPLPYRWAFIGLLASAGGLMLICVFAGMQPIVAFTLVVLALLYMTAATRIRAETGNAWLFGPNIDVNTLMSRTFGTGLLTPQDLTVLAFMRPALANFDMRCLPMPHQFEAFKMMDGVAELDRRTARRRLFGAILIGTLFGATVSMVIALMIWHGFGAEAKTEPWRTSQGKVPFDNLSSLLRNPVAPDIGGILAVGFGFLATTVLLILRTQFVWWPLHPVGYAMANTSTMDSTWFPFFLAWLLKTLTLRYGGAQAYRAALPFFLGLIAGDLLGGGLTTALGAFTGINVYPINW